jgi:hypothetical protein
MTNFYLTMLDRIGVKKRRSATARAASSTSDRRLKDVVSTLTSHY